jgi:hypothetical protein
MRINPAELPAPGKFPYELLLAFHRGEVLDRKEQAQIRDLVEKDPRWRAHYESVRYLDLERAAARQDAEDLKRFASDTPFCRSVAQTQGQVFAEHTSAEDWASHVDGCIYCRRMWRRWHARTTAAPSLPEGEPLLRDWLLERYYLAALDDVTRRLAKPAVDDNLGELSEFFHRDLTQFLARMEQVAPLMFERVLPPGVPHGDHAASFLDYLRTDPIQETLAKAGHVRDALGGVLADYCRAHQLGDPMETRAAITRTVLDNILWQTAVEARKSASRDEAEHAGLQQVEDELCEQLRHEEPEPAHLVARRVLARSPQIPARLRKRLVEEFARFTGDMPAEA